MTNTSDFAMFLTHGQAKRRLSQLCRKDVKIVQCRYTDPDGLAYNRYALQAKNGLLLTEQEIGD